MTSLNGGTRPTRANNYLRYDFIHDHVHVRAHLFIPVLTKRQRSCGVLYCKTGLKGVGKQAGSIVLQLDETNSRTRKDKGYAGTQLELGSYSICEQCPL